MFQWVWYQGEKKERNFVLYCEMELVVLQFNLVDVSLDFGENENIMRGMKIGSFFIFIKFVSLN